MNARVVLITSMYFVFLTAALFSLKGNFMNMLISHDSKEQTLKEYIADYNRIKTQEKTKLVRGEYETKDEFKLRQEKSKVKATFNLQDALMKTQLKLKYDVDNETFSFPNINIKGFTSIYKRPSNGYFCTIDKAFLKHSFADRITYKAAKSKSWYGTGFCITQSQGDAFSTEERCNTIHLKHFSKKYFDDVFINGRANVKYHEISGGNSFLRIPDNEMLIKLYFGAKSKVESARMLKMSEKSLIVNLVCDINYEDYNFRSSTLKALHIHIKAVEVVNLETNETLFAFPDNGYSIKTSEVNFGELPPKADILRKKAP